MTHLLVCLECMTNCSEIDLIHENRHWRSPTLGEENMTLLKNNVICIIYTVYSTHTINNLHLPLLPSECYFITTLYTIFIFHRISVV